MVQIAWAQLNQLLTIRSLSGEEGDAVDFCFDVLRGSAFELAQDCSGNLHGRRVAPYPSPVTLCAHLDHAREAPGYDDKAGLAIILGAAVATRVAFDLLLTVSEETNHEGTTGLLHQEHTWSAQLIVLLDRGGDHDLVTSVEGMRTCSPEMERELMDHAGLEALGYRAAEGWGGDIIPLSRLADCVNLSVGYHDAHTPNEWLSESGFARACEATIRILKAAPYLVARGDHERAPVGA